MKDSLFPARGVVPPPLSLRSALLAAGLALLAALVFWLPLLTGGALSGSDWSTHHYHYFDWIRISLRRFGTLPLYMPDSVMTPNFLANAESPLLGPLTPLLLVLDTDSHLKLLIVLYTAAGLAGGWLLLRDLGVPALVAALGAILFSLGGFLPAHLAAGHPWALGTQVLPGLVCAYRRAALGSQAALWLAAFLGASVILGGQHQPFIWQYLFLAGFALLWAASARAAFPIVRLGWLLAATAGLAAPKLLPMLAEFADYAPTAKIQGLPLSALATTLLARGQGPGLGVDGLAYTHGAGWWEYAFYLGPVAILCILVGSVAAGRAGWGLLALAVGFLWLALDPPLRLLDPWALLGNLPVWRTQRAPSRFLELAIFAFSLLAALGLGRLFERAQQRSRRLALAAACALALLVAVDLFVESLVWQRAAVGPPIPEREHRPQPLSYVLQGGARVDLIESAPNRFVYRVSTPVRALGILPLRWGKSRVEWELDEGEPLNPLGRLAVVVGPGESRVGMTFRPPLRWAGVGVFALTLCVFIGERCLRWSRAG
jgi:hypothetical protein